MKVKLSIDGKSGFMVGKKMQIFKNHFYFLEKVAFFADSPDSRMLIFGSTGEIATVYSKFNTVG